LSNISASIKEAIIKFIPSKNDKAEAPPFLDWPSNQKIDKQA